MATIFLVIITEIALRNGRGLYHKTSQLKSLYIQITKFKGKRV